MMEKFLKMLEEKGIKDKLLTAFQTNPDISLADIIEYEMAQDENLEDCFLEEAHTEAMNTVIGAILVEDLKQYFMNEDHLDKLKDDLQEAGQKIADAFNSVLTGLFEDKNTK